MLFFWLSRKPGGGEEPMTAAHEVLPKPGLLGMLWPDRRGAGLQRRVSQVLLLVVLTPITIATVCSQSLVQADPHRFATVPALAVSSSDGKEIGGLHYIVIQLDRDPKGKGPTVLFSERSKGAVVDEEWKEGVRVAVSAAAATLGEDSRNWTITIKNQAYLALTKGSSASSAVAVGIMAASRGEGLRPGVALTGAITADGGIDEVDGLPSKLEGAAMAHMHTLLVPKGQARTEEWDLPQLGRLRNITVIEVGSLREAYELMTGKQR
jgi:predicted S18 family serine protease